MSAHIVNGRFQSDKYPTCPAGKVPLSTRDPMAQDLLWEYAQRRREVDAEFADDLETCLRADGYKVPGEGCTGIAAAWCPIHGDCTCPDREEALDEPSCPLHNAESTHGCRPGDDR